MKGSEKVEMTLNIGGEFFKLSADYDQQYLVREAESAVKQYYNKLRRDWPDSSDRKILAMAAYQFAFWHRELMKLQTEALELADSALQKFDDSIPDVSPSEEIVPPMDF